MSVSWAAQRERGAPAVTRAALWLALNGGRAAAPLLLWPATLWFLLTAARARAASRDYLARVLPHPPRLLDVLRHFHAFATAVLDRTLLLAGRERGFVVQTEGLAPMLDVLAEGRGCILMGAHLGSFEVLRSVATRAPVPVWALMYRRNQGALTRLFDRLNPALHDRTIEIGDTASMIRIRECIERGEIVGLLADRAPPGGRVAQRMVSAPFMGQPALFPSGPFVLAAALGAPVFLFHAVRTGPRLPSRPHYDVRFTPFMDRVVLRRASRAADLQACVDRYAAAVEAACRANPFQWFNFFPFWEQAPDAEPDAEPDSPPHAAAGDRPARLPGCPR